LGGTYNGADDVSACYGESVGRGPNSGNRELPVSMIALDSVSEEELQGVFFIGYLSGRDASIRARIDVPSLNFPTAATMSLVMRVIGTSAGTLPDLTYSYRRIAVSDADPGYSLPLVDTAASDIQLSTLNGGNAITANTVFEFTAPPISIAKADTVFLEIGRSGVTDGYPGTVGLIRTMATVQPA